MVTLQTYGAVGLRPFAVLLFRLALESNTFPLDRPKLEPGQWKPNH